MPTITLATVQTNLALWLAADAALATGQMFSMNGRSLTRTDAEEVRKQINFWSGQEARLERGARNSGKDNSRVGFSVAKLS